MSLATAIFVIHILIITTILSTARLLVSLVDTFHMSKLNAIGVSYFITIFGLVFSAVNVLGTCGYLPQSGEGELSQSCLRHSITRQ